MPSNTVLLSPLCTVPCRCVTCCAMTESTSMLMRLNSSKHANAPDDARPYGSGKIGIRE